MLEEETVKEAAQEGLGSAVGEPDSPGEIDDDEVPIETLESRLTTEEVVEEEEKEETSDPIHAPG